MPVQKAVENWQECQPLSWYDTWLVSQFAKLPKDVLDIFPTPKGKSDKDYWEPFISAFFKIKECLTSDGSITIIDRIISRLYDEGLLVLPPAEGEEDIITAEHYLEYARYFVFCVLGWQTMLFTPAALGDASSNDLEPPRLAIDEQPGCCGYTHMSLEVSTRGCPREPLSEFLMGFGVLLPSKNMCLDEDPNVQRVFYNQTEVHARIFNAYTLSAVGGLRIKRVDAIACHLEFNSTTKELSLFRFPSFCESLLANYARGRRRGALHACATTSYLRCQWASEDEVNQLLAEILLSFRLLFGQTRKSRLLFRSSLNPFSGHSKDNIRDPLLSTLCGSKEIPCDDGNTMFNGLVQKETYYLPRDFPILRYRMAIFQRYLSSTVPRTWAQLWRDNRDSAGWLTFWAVIVFGVFGSVMAFLQVVLQFVQLVAQ